MSCIWPYQDIIYHVMCMRKHVCKEIPLCTYVHMLLLVNVQMHSQQHTHLHTPTHLHTLAVVISIQMQPQ